MYTIEHAICTLLFVTYNAALLNINQNFNVISLLFTSCTYCFWKERQYITRVVHIKFIFFHIILNHFSTSYIKTQIKLMLLDEK